MKCQLTLLHKALVPICLNNRWDAKCGGEYHMGQDD